MCWKNHGWLRVWEDLGFAIEMDNFIPNRWFSGVGKSSPTSPSGLKQVVANINLTSSKVIPNM